MTKAQAKKQLNKEIKSVLVHFKAAAHTAVENNYSEIIVTIDNFLLKKIKMLEEIVNENR